MFKTIFSFAPGVAALKPVMKIVTGLDLGPTRFPHQALPEDKEKELSRVLRETGLFNLK